MVAACLDETIDGALEQRGTVLLLPAAHAIPPITYSWKHLPQLLDAGQHLSIDVEEHSVTLCQGQRVQAQCILRPLAFRLFLMLLLAHQQGRSSSYPELLAIKIATDEQVATLLQGADEATWTWLKRETETQRRVLQRIEEAGTRERELKPLRRAIRDQYGLGKILAACHFPWEVQSRYSRGYRLVRLPIPVQTQYQRRR